MAILRLRQAALLSNPATCGLLALVYVRQSTPQQVQNNAESTGRQYALAERAQRRDPGAAPGCVHEIWASGWSAPFRVARSGASV